MFQRILVPLDGSALAEKALPYAVELAKASSGRLMLLQATEIHGVAGTIPSLAQQQAVEQAERNMGAVADRLSDGGLKVEPYAFLGEAAEAIAEEAALRRADAIVMSTHGRSGIGRWIYGSVAQGVLQRSSVPVLLVPASCQTAWLGEQERSVVVALDGSDLAEQALPAATELAGRLGASLLLVQVVVPPTPSAYGGTELYLEVGPDELLQYAREYLATVERQLQDKGLRIDSEARLGAPSITIARIAFERNAWAIAMASHGRGGIARAVMGSVANGVVHYSPVPVLVTRPQQATAKVRAKAHRRALASI